MNAENFSAMISLEDGDLYRERVRRARLMPPEEKLFAGPELFDYACEITLQGIHNQHPEADERRVREILAERLALQRKLEEGA